MASLSQINIKLSALNVASGFSDLTSAVSKTASSIQALNSTSLGGTLNETLSGVQALNTTSNAALSVALLTANLTGLSSQIIEDVSASKTDLDKITGSSVDNSFNTLLYTSGTAEGIKKAINTVATPTEKQLSAILTNVVPKQFSAQVSELVVKDFNTLSAETTAAINSFSSSFANLVGTLTGNPLQDIILQTDLEPISKIENLGVPSDQAGSILLLLQNDQFNDAVNNVVALTGKAVAEVERELSLVPTNISDQIDRLPNDNSVATFEPSSKNNKWNGSQTPNSFFDIIPSEEQLQVEMVNSSREITEIIFFAHETTIDQTIKAGEIHNSYIKEGIDGIPFHFVVLPNGNLQRGRPISSKGLYSSTHQEFSIGVVIPVVQNQLASIEQVKTVKQIIRAFYEVWPGGRVLDAQLDIGDSELNTGMNIHNIIASFDKANIGSTGRSLSTQQLIATAQGSV